MSTTKKNVKENVLPHSQAKLNLYRDYLSEYLPILGNSIYIDRINIFDIFCGSGIYSDGNLGSPLIAASQILNYIMSFSEHGKALKPIRLIINDFDEQKVNHVTDVLEGLPLTNCQIEPYNLDAEAMFDLVASKVNQYDRRERNLVFIDPYGYSKIQKRTLLKILENNRSEVILFLPVAQMYRFTGKAQTDFETRCFENLRRFTQDFFEGNTKALNNRFSDVFDYINELTRAFSFNNRFYTSSHYIQRDNANYYAVFFIGHHIYGLEKFLEVKWKNDSLGKGFNKSSLDNTLFGSMDVFDKTFTEERFAKILIDFIRQRHSCNNIDLYEYTLVSQFQIKHCNSVIKTLKKEKKILIQDLYGNIVNNSGYGITYQNYKDKKIKYTFKMKDL